MILPIVILGGISLYTNKYNICFEFNTLRNSLELI